MQPLDEKIIRVMKKIRRKKLLLKVAYGNQDPVTKIFNFERYPPQCNA